ncbi:Sec-independent protein translocase TatA [Paenibacillus selenitireducens]|uniref:Sec-independent protein translocase protein TatA n=1 Tax=Paenibacillus selenitireducens TaxID=1324314 RepID=A0A1T2X2K0_9BACL|nr:twin-arginine translocase TatA/TatE family subunit [Paenibacillus selenitireducens]OPA74079.1 Sec-independent protein translocase TatA [Paenibacillus selenitireducens]
MGGIGVTGFILLIIVALLLFGPNKLPQLGRAVGRTLREFKEGARDIISDTDDEEDRKPAKREVRSVDSAPASTSADPQQVNNKRLPD